MGYRDGWEHRGWWEGKEGDIRRMGYMRQMGTHRTGLEDFKGLKYVALISLALLIPLNIKENWQQPNKLV